MDAIITAIIGGIFGLAQIYLIVKLQQLHKMVNSQQAAQNVRAEGFAERTGNAEAELRARKEFDANSGEHS